MKTIRCFATKESQCDARARFIVEKKGDLSHRKAFYCNECVAPYRDSDEGKKYFVVTPIDGDV